MKLSIEARKYINQRMSGNYEFFPTLHVLQAELKKKFGVDVHESTIHRAIEKNRARHQLLQHFGCPDMPFMVKGTDTAKVSESDVRMLCRQNPKDNYVKRYLSGKPE